MKKIVVFLLIAIFPAKAFNQISQGSIVVGGEFSLSVSKNKTEQGNNTDDGPTRTSFSLIPNVEYFLADNLSAGIGIGYSLDRSKSETTNSETIRKDGTFLVTPYLKKYFSLGDKAYFYGQALVILGFGKESNEFKTGNITTSSEENHNSMGVGIVPGFRYDITERIGLEAGIGFIGFTSNVDKTGSGDNEGKDITNTFEFSFIPNSLTLGIRYTMK